MILLDLIALDIDPNVVKPGWTPLLITIAMAAVLVLLYRSMRRQFRRIDVSRSQPGSGDQTSVPGPDSTAEPVGRIRDPAGAPPEPFRTPPGSAVTPPEPVEGQR